VDAHGSACFFAARVKRGGGVARLTSPNPRTKVDQLGKNQNTFEKRRREVEKRQRAEEKRKKKQDIKDLGDDRPAPQPPADYEYGKQEGE
jgi:hypothetical protein